LPFFGAMVAALMMITYIPAISLYLPVQTKQLKKSDVEKSTFMQPKKKVDAEKEDAKEEPAK